MKTVLTAAWLLTPQERIRDPLLVVEDGLVSDVAARSSSELPAGARVLEYPDATLAPGYVDVHIHGAAGHDVMEPDTSGLLAIERLLAEHGVTSYCPTTVTAPIDQTLAALEKLADAIEAAQRIKVRDDVRARPLAIHLEGPFISHAKRGAHPPEHIQAASIQLFDRFWQAARGHIRIITVAPELPGACELITEAARRGVCVSLGHSDADLETARAGIAAGARHATHTFNAMRALHHRDPGMLGAVLTDTRCTADIIADGVHVDPALIEIFLKVKGRDAVLISDAISATGMADGRYRLGCSVVEVRGDRCLSAEGKLAGSVLTLDRAVRNVMQFAGWELAQAVPLATFNPARLLGIESNTGVLARGAAAEVAVLSSSGEVMETICGGMV